MNFYQFGKAISYIAARLIFKIRYEGLENIPEGGGYIIVCNHISGFDPIIIAHKIAPQIHYIAKAELTANPIMGLIMKGLGVIPIKRGGGDTSALDQGVEFVREGRILGVFPEGKRSKDGQPLRPRLGVSVIAGQSKADILPVAVSYGGMARFRASVTVRYGPVIPSDKITVDLNSPASLRAASKFIMSEIIALLDKVPDPGLPEKEENVPDLSFPNEEATE